MMLMPTALHRGTVIQNYLDEIGITIKLDVADPGRYWGSIFATGWEGLLLYQSRRRDRLAYMG